MLGTKQAVGLAGGFSLISILTLLLALSALYHKVERMKTRVFDEVKVGLCFCWG